MRTINKIIIIHCAALPLIPDGARGTPHRETSIDLCLVKDRLGLSEAQHRALKGFVSQLTRQFPTAAIEDSYVQPL